MKKLLAIILTTAMALTSGSAVFAADYPDVESQAVTELSALGIINGYEDGTFRPEETVSRAEITKMIITALGETAVAASKASEGKDTQFADVTAKHWAAGYITTGTSATAGNFINGYSTTAFGPEDNVTYAQAVKMLVAALGYSSFAENEGGWPNGYLKYGYSLGLLEGVTGINNDEAATRLNVAQMIDNALKCPICVSAGYETDAWGRPVPVVEIKDGTGDLYGAKDGYQNLLNYAHDAYLVYGRVTGTSRTGACEIDELQFAVEKSDNWLGYDVKADDEDDAENVIVYKGNVTDYELYAYSEAIIAEDENEEYTFISITPYGATESVELATELYRNFEIGNKYDTLEIYKDNSKSKYNTYKLNSDLKIFVNGVEYNGTLPEVVENNESGTITLIDSSDTAKSSVDGKYDVAMVTKYIDAVVDYVEVENDEVLISFKATSDSDVYELVVDLEDEDIEYNFTLDGKVIAAADLEENDVLTIAYDMADGKSFVNSNHYDIIVSRDVVDAKLKSTDSSEGEYTFSDGETYKLAWANAVTLVNGDSYTLYLNAFGKIAYTDDVASAKKFAILENVYLTNGGADYAVTLITSEGKANYLADSENYNTLKNILMGDNVDYFEDSDKMEMRASVEDRVIEYTIKSNGEVRVRNSVNVEDVIDGEYKASTNKLDSTKISDDITVIIDVQEYLDGDDAITMSNSDLVDGTTYAGYSYGEVGSNNVAQLVLITSGTAGLNVNSNMAIYVSDSTEDTENGSMYAINAYVNGKLTTLLSDNEYNLVAGDAFFYTKDSDGYIKDITPIFATNVNDTYKAFYNNALDAKFDVLAADVVSGFAGGEGVKFNRGDVDDCELVFGAVVASANGEISVATVDSVTDTANYDINDAIDYDIADDVTVYKYDYEYNRTKDRVSATSVAALNVSSLPAKAYDKDTEILDFTSEVLTDTNDNYGRIKLALLKVVDDEVVEAIVYIPSTSKD